MSFKMPEERERHNSELTPKLKMGGKNETNDMLNYMTPYGKLENEDENDPYRDDLSDLHNISMAEAIEHD